MHNEVLGGDFELGEADNVFDEFDNATRVVKTEEHASPVKSLDNVGGEFVTPILPITTSKENESGAVNSVKDEINVGERVDDAMVRFRSNPYAFNDAINKLSNEIGEDD